MTLEQMARELLEGQGRLTRDKSRLKKELSALIRKHNELVRSWKTKNKQEPELYTKKYRLLRRKLMTIADQIHRAKEEIYYTRNALRKIERKLNPAKEFPAPAEKPEVKPAEKPEVKPAEKPEVKPAEKPEVKPAEKPEVKPAEKPAEKPDGRLEGALRGLKNLGFKESEIKSALQDILNKNPNISIEDLVQKALSSQA